MVEAAASKLGLTEVLGVLVEVAFLDAGPIVVEVANKLTALLAAKVVTVAAATVVIASNATTHSPVLGPHPYLVYS